MKMAEEQNQVEQPCSLIQALTPDVSLLFPSGEHGPFSSNATREIFCGAATYRGRQLHAELATTAEDRQVSEIHG